jgi:hypothetical protein
MKMLYNDFEKQASQNLRECFAFSAKKMKQASQNLREGFAFSTKNMKQASMNLENVPHSLQI